MSYKIKRQSFALTVVGGGTAAATSAATALNGVLKGITVVATALDAAATLTLTVADADGVTVYTKASIATATAAKTGIYIDANNQPLSLPLSGSYTVSVTPSGSSAADHIQTVTLLIQS